MRYKRSHRLHILYVLSTLGHVAFFVWGLPWLATLPQGRLYATPVRITVDTLDTASRVTPSDGAAKPARPQSVIRSAAAPSPAPAPTLPAPTPKKVTKVRPPVSPPPPVTKVRPPRPQPSKIAKVKPPVSQPPKVAKVKPPVAQPSPSQRRARPVRPRRRTVQKRLPPRPTVQKQQPATPPPPSPPATPPAPAVAETPMQAQPLPASPAGAAVVDHAESPARTPAKPATVASLPPPQGWVPRFAYKPCPRYPYVARRRRVEGTVILRFAVLPAGTIGDIKVVKSSGNASLDKAAQKAVRKWRPLPDKGVGRDNAWVYVPFTFALTAQNGRNGHGVLRVPAGRVAINCDAVGKQ